MDKTKDLYEELIQEHGKLKWVANVEKDDESVRLKGHIVGPPKADDQYSAEELDEMGVVGIYVRAPKEKKKHHRNGHSE
jgi:hypothetical protein